MLEKILDKNVDGYTLPHIKHELFVICPHCGKDVVITINGYITSAAVYECTECKEWFRLIPTETGRRSDDSFFSNGV